MRYMSSIFGHKMEKEKASPDTSQVENAPVEHRGVLFGAPEPAETPTDWDAKEEKKLV